MQRLGRPYSQHLAKTYEYRATSRGRPSFNRGGTNCDSDEHVCSLRRHATDWHRGRIIGACLGVLFGCAVARAVSELL